MKSITPAWKILISDTPASEDPKMQKRPLLRALWKIPLGVLLLIIQVNLLREAMAGDGWLQMSAEAVGYWVVWLCMVWLALFLLYRGIRDVRTTKV